MVAVASLHLKRSVKKEKQMSGIEASILAAAAVLLCWLESIRSTLKDCLKSLEKIASK